MNVIYMDKNFKKVNADEMRAIKKGVDKLRDKIAQYEHDGIPFEQIYNDDSVKYDVLGNNYYTYKAQTQRFPLRILYKYIREGKDGILQIHMSYLKKYNDKRYIDTFSQYASCH